jgi:hypothetical protein
MLFPLSYEGKRETVPRSQVAGGPFARVSHEGTVARADARAPVFPAGGPERHFEGRRAPRMIEPTTSEGDGPKLPVPLFR